MSSATPADRAGDPPIRVVSAVPDRDAWPPLPRFLALLAAMATGAVMIARGMVLVFGGDPQAAYVAGGTFKPTHAVTDGIDEGRLLEVLYQVIDYRSS